MPRISIALATYNGARHLEEQLATLAGQTLLPLELVVSDDGSTDGTLEIARQFASSAPFPVHIIEGEGRLGYRLNFRRAAQRCRGDLIAFCDQDDRWHPNKLERIAQSFTDPDVLLAYHNATVFDGESKRPLHFAAVEAAREGAPFRECNGLLQVFRSSLRQYDALWDRSVDQNEGNVILAHDQWYFFLATALGKVVFVDEPLLDYRQHGSNVYGVKVQESALSRLLLRFSHFGDQDRWAADSASSRAEVLSAIAVERPNLQVLAQRYAELAERLKRRNETYTRDSVVGRAKAWISGVRDYGSQPWAFAAPSAARDLWHGVLLGAKVDPTRST